MNNESKKVLERARASEDIARKATEKALADLRIIVGTDATKAILTVISRMSAYDRAMDHVSEVDTMIKLREGSPR